MSNPVLFHSFYSDEALSSLKHALLYFGHVSIPDDSFLVIPSTEGYRDRYVQLIPDHMRDDLESLRKQGFVEFAEPSGAGDFSTIELAKMIARERELAPGRPYDPLDFMPIFDSLSLNPRLRDDIGTANQVTVFLAAICLRSVAVKGAVPCVDNRILFEEILFGFRGLFQGVLEDEAFSQEEIAELKAQLLSQRLFSVYLPSFEFRSFDEVLELRSKLVVSINAFRERMLELGRELKKLPWEAGFTAEVERMVVETIEPQVRDLRREAGFSVPKIAKQAMGAACALTLQAVLPDIISTGLLGLSAYSLREAMQNEVKRAQAVRIENAFGMLLEIERES